MAVSPHLTLVAPYPAYKTSNISWIGEVPTHWEIRRLKHVGSAKIGLTYSPANVVGEDDGTLVLRASNIQNGKISYHDNVYVNSEIPAQLIMRNGDILVCSRSGSRDLIGKNALVDSAAEGKSFGAFMTVFRSAHNKYVHYVFNSGFFQHHVGAFGTSTVNQLTLEIFLNLKIPLPPLPEQRAIARYLDYMDRRIQRYIRAKERLIELLEEQKRAVINQAVTRGLDPDVPLKPSEVEWLGDVPAHWEVRRLGATVKDLQSGAWGDEPTGSVDDIICVRVADFDRHRKRVDVGNLTIRSVDERTRNKCRLLRGDLLIEKSGGGDASPVGTVVLFDHDIEAITSNFVSRMNISKDHDHNFINYVHSTLYDMRINTLAIKQTTGIQNLDIKAYLNTKIAVPPKLEQERTAQFLDSASSQIEILIVNAFKQIDLIREYRTRLISDVVTGKLDVREAVANLPDDLGEDGLLEPGDDLERLEAANIG